MCLLKAQRDATLWVQWKGDQSGHVKALQEEVFPRCLSLNAEPSPSPTAATVPVAWLARA